MRLLQSWLNDRISQIEEAGCIKAERSQSVEGATDLCRPFSCSYSTSISSYSFILGTPENHSSWPDRRRRCCPDQFTQARIARIIASKKEFRRRAACVCEEIEH